VVELLSTGRIVKRDQISLYGSMPSNGAKPRSHLYNTLMDDMSMAMRGSNNGKHRLSQPHNRLWLSVAACDRELFETMLHSTRLSDTNSLQQNLLHVAARSNAHWAIEPLCSSLDTNALDDQGNTPLHIAAQSNHIETCVQLLNQGADLALCNTEGKKPDEMSTTQVMQGMFRSTRARKVAQDAMDSILSCASP
jgi:Ankyrin repeats (3 copies)